MKKFSILSMSVILIGTLVCISCAYLISTAILSSNLFQHNQVSIEKQSLYCISLSKSKVENEVLAQKTDLQAQNGAGYVYKKDDYYFLIASIYENLNDAEKVKTNFKNNGIECEIIAVEIDASTLKGNFSNDEKTILLETLKADFSAYKSLYDIAISLDTNVFDKTKAKLQCNNVFSSHVSTKTNFQTFFKNYSSENFVDEIQNQILHTEQCLSNLISEVFDSASQTFSSLIKQTYCKILLD